MTEHELLTAAGVALAFLTWMLALSYGLGRYAARTDANEHNLQEFRLTVQKIYDRIDSIAAMVPHVCSQEARLAVLEERQLAFHRETGYDQSAQPPP